MKILYTTPNLLGVVYIIKLLVYMKYLLFIIHILILAGCTSVNKKDDINYFDKTIVLKDMVEIFSDEEEPMGRISKICVSDNHLVVRNTGADNFFSLIDINNKSNVRKIIQRGRANNEFVSISRNFEVFDNRLIFLDDAKREINILLIDSLKSDQNNIVGDKVKYPYVNEFRPRDFVATKELLIFNGAFANSYIGSTYWNGKIVDNDTYFPFRFPDVSRLMHIAAVQTIMRSNINKSQVVVATRCSDLFEIYNITQNNIELKYMRNYTEIPVIKSSGGRIAINGNESINGIYALEVSEDFIYIMYSKEKLNQPANSDTTSEILCFDWYGNKIAKYILPLVVNCFCVDNNHLYVVTVNESQLIYKLEL